MNVVTLAGRTTRAVEIRTTNNGNIMARFTLAVDRFKKDKGADFINCVVFGKPAEVMEQCNVGTGTKLIVNGRWQTGSYEGRNGKVYTNDCVVDNWEFAESKGSGLRPAQPEGAEEEKAAFLDVPKEFEIEEGGRPFV